MAWLKEYNQLSDKTILYVLTELCVSHSNYCNFRFLLQTSLRSTMTVCEQRQGLLRLWFCTILVCNKLQILTFLT